MYDTNGKLLRKENIIDYTKTNILGTMRLRILLINGHQNKKKIQELFRERGINLDILKIEQGWMTLMTLIYLSCGF